MQETSSIKDMPVLESLLDADFYKDTMGQMIFHKHPRVPVKFALHNRSRRMRLAECVDPGRLRENLEHARTLRFTRSELEYLAGASLYGEPMFKLDYIEFLRGFRLPEFHLGARAGQLILEFYGEWACVSRWETLGMSLVAELYGASLENPPAYAEGERRLAAKMETFGANPGITFSDFGTRRRFSRAWQERVIDRLAGNPQFLGTSNTALAMKHGLTPMGTNAHELPMVYSAIYREEDEQSRRLMSQLHVLEHWEEEYGLGLSIFLPDTFGSSYFFSGIAGSRLRAWKGSRHDSGPPKDYGDRCIRMYEAAGIDPAGKLIVFADSLTPPLVDELERHFRGRIKTTFGIGTNLTNDLGPAALSIVVKPVEAAGLPVVKLSDDPSKATGHPSEMDRIRRLITAANCANSAN